jgi:hypothetical protein
MYEDISETRYTAPRDIRVETPEITGNPFGRFANYLQLPNHRVLPMGLGHELIIPDGDIFTYSFNSFQYVSEVKLISFHKLTAC